MQWFQEGSLHADTWILETGTENWIPLSSVRSTTPKAILSPPPIIPLATSQQNLSSHQDETIFSDSTVLVTTTRVVLNGTTYALRNITSIRMGLTPAKHGCAIFLLLGGMFFVLTGLAVLFSDSHMPVPLIIGIIVVILAILWLRSNKPTYHVVIASSSGEVHALTSKNKGYIESIINSINEAIIRYK